MKIVLNLIFFMPFAVMLITSCKKDQPILISLTQRLVPPQPPSPNHPPKANAGTDQTIVLPKNSTTIFGDASYDPDANDRIASYKWTKISGPDTFNIVNPSVAVTEVTNLVMGVYRFELEVIDMGGLYAKDTVAVSVHSPSIVIQSQGRELIFTNLTWLNNSASRYVYAETPTMPNGYSTDSIISVSLYAWFALFGTPGWREISKDGLTTGIFYYKVQNGKIVVYKYYDTYNSGLTFLVYNSVRVIFF